jgi:hypothetical protein
MNWKRPVKPMLAHPFIVLIPSIGPTARALVNPAVQPGHLFDAYDHVFAAPVERVDGKSPTVALAIKGAAKGVLPHKRDAAVDGGAANAVEPLR